ncbi:MAG: LytTR family DNA-binding domain-containing protein [Ferruginibacter sp.]
MNALKIPRANNIREVIVKEIIRVEALSNYSRIHLSNGKKIVVAKVLHWFEDELPIEMFTRVHRSHLINKHFIQQVKGIRSKTLLLNNGESISISRRKKIALNSFLS